MDQINKRPHISIISVPISSQVLLSESNTPAYKHKTLDTQQPRPRNFSPTARTQFGDEYSSAISRTRTSWIDRGQGGPIEHVALILLPSCLNIHGAVVQVRCGRVGARIEPYGLPPARTVRILSIWWWLIRRPESMDGALLHHSKNNKGSMNSKLRKGQR